MTRLHGGGTISDETEATATEAAPRTPRSKARLAEIVLPLLAYAAVCLSGASTSSLGNRVLRQDPADPLGTMWGSSLDIRSDEWLTGTAVELNVLSLGHASSSPMSYSPDLVVQVASGQPFETLFFFEGNLLRLGPWLPDTMLFAASRAFPLLVLALTLPPLLQRLGSTRAMSWFGYALVVLAPATLWWSFTPARVLSFASLGCFLLVLATERWTTATATRSRAAALAIAAVGGICTGPARHLLRAVEPDHRRPARAGRGGLAALRS